MALWDDINSAYEEFHRGLGNTLSDVQTMYGKFQEGNDYINKMTSPFPTEVVGGTQSGISQNLIPNLSKAKQQYKEVAEQYPNPPEIGTEGNRRLFGWLANRIGHGIQYPTQTVAKGLETLTPGSEQELLDSVMGVAPGMIASNFRTPQVIQQLRRVMAEEMRARGPIGSVSGVKTAPFLPQEISEMQGGRTQNLMGFDPNKLVQTTDPIDQILRGSWYHGSSPAERDAVRRVGFQGSAKDPEFAEHFLRRLNEVGFQGSTHSGGPAISNVLGEPYGTSLTMLPTEGVQFTQGVDKYIHRVQPQYGGPPTQRTVNLMTPEGRGTLNDAYDIVFNKQLQSPVRGWPQQNWMDIIAERFLDKKTVSYDTKNLNELFSHVMPGGLSQQGELGSFNQTLSNQLQSQGKRGILYNPQRWDEYEMLMLDPKYALPLDYRKAGEYANPNWSRVSKSGSPYQAGSPVLDIATATPGVQKGLSQIQDIMFQNKSRLGDIYSERPWTQRLNEENKQRLLELIGSRYREQVGNQLYGR